MPEIEPRPISPTLEDILTPAEAALMQQAEQGHLACPACGAARRGEKAVEEIYQGIRLVCPGKGCGYQEY